MEKIKEKFKDNSLTILIFILIILILTIPLMQNKLIYGDDMWYHLLRIQSIADSLKCKNFFTKINASMANGYGYASSMFYPDFFLYFPAVLIAFLNFSLINSYKIFIFFLLIMMFLVFYKSFLHISENKNIALLGTAFLMLSKVLILCLYSRFALGEFIGFIFILPGLVGIYDYLYKDFSKPQFLILSFSGLINSHLITGLIMFLFCLIAFILNIKNTIRNPKKFLKLLGCACLVLLFTAYFWMPLIEQLLHQKFYLSNSWTAISNEEYTILDYFTNPKYSVGYSLIVSLPFVLYGLFSKKSKNHAKRYFFCFIIISIFLICSPIWNIFSKELNIIQFKWRLLGIITNLYAFSFALVMDEYTSSINLSKQKNILLILFSILLFFTLDNYNNYYVGNIKYDELYIKENLYNTIESLGGGFEYLPIEVENPLNIFQSITNIAYINGKDIKGEKYPNLIFNLNNNDVNGDNIEIPYIYYYGYVARLTKENGEIIPLEVYKGNNGLVNVRIPNGLKGDIFVIYGRTLVQKVSFVISFLSIIAMIICTIHRFKK